jgi:4-amino-4-deoxy-L-arabinose transferase-like glycosyltransferase
MAVAVDRMMGWAATRASWFPAWVRGLAAAGLAFLFLGWGAWQLPLMDRDEPRFSEASREMLAGGDWVVPRLNGEHRFDKPPLIYWMQAASMACLGRNEGAVRLPSIVCALLTVVATGLWTRRMATPRAGVWAAMILLTSPQFYVHAHLAVADMAMVLGFVMAGWCGWELLRPGRGPWVATGWYWGLLGSLAFGFLAKGPVAWLPVVPLAWAGWRRSGVGSDGRPGRRVRPWEVLLAVVVVLAWVGCWGIPALVRTQGEYWNIGMGKHVAARSVGVLEGHGLKGLLGYVGSLPFYLLTFPLGFLPWSPLLFQKLRARAPWRSGDATAGYVLGGTALVFVVFTLVRTKLPHYTLPAFPWLAAWLGCELDRGGMTSRAMARLAGGAALVLGLLAGVVVPWASTRLIAHDMAKAAVPLLRPGMAVATLGFQEPSVYWYLRPDGGPWVRHLEDEPEAIRFMEEGGPRMLVVSDSAVASRVAARFPDVRRGEAAGWNPVRGRRVTLWLLAR